MKKLLSLILAALVCAAPIGCTSAPDSPTAQTTAVSDEYVGLSAEEAMVKRTLLNIGNTERLSRAIEKAQSGKDVTIAYIGGSITEGYNAPAESCYAKTSAESFEKRFCKNGAKVKAVNAGMSGTPSVIGCVRADRDVKPCNPDIVVVEFAVNDAKDSEHQIAFESLVRTFLQYESKPAVIVLINVIKSGHTCRDQMLSVGEYYSLGVVSNLTRGV